MKLICSLIIIAFIALQSISAQEIECNVKINHSQIQGTNIQVFKTLEIALTDFINGRKWTKAQYEANERIRCSMNLTIKSYDENEGRWSGELIVQSTRPVYQSGYQSVLFSFKDPDVEFNYREFDALELRENQIDNNLVAVVAYYIYLMMGLDMDAMAHLGGDEPLFMAQNIVNEAQGLNEKGWKAFESSRNRYALINDYLDEGMKPLRQLYYDYHRKGMDEMAVNATRARATLTLALPLLITARDNKPMSSLPMLFTEIKRDELVNIYGLKSPSVQNERDEIYKTLSSITPSLNNEWSKIKSK